MARSTKLAFLAVAVLLLQASWCALSQPGNGATPGVMVVSSFEDDGGQGTACDDNFYSNGDMVVALSTGWYAGGSRCHKKISIKSTQTGRTATAEVVDECDVLNGCETNMIATSKAVWDALGVDTNIGQVPIQWADA